MNNRFTVRIELHKIAPDHEVYNILHEEMENAGFLRTIKGNDGAVYNLPHGEYNIVGNYTAEHVFQKAKNAASLTEKEYSVIVTPSDGRYWTGLQKVLPKLKRAS